MTTEKELLAEMPEIKRLNEQLINLPEGLGKDHFIKKLLDLQNQLLSREKELKESENEVSDEMQALVDEMRSMEEAVALKLLTAAGLLEVIKDFGCVPVQPSQNADCN